MSLAAAGKWAFPSEGIFEDLRIQQCINAGFATEQSGFALLIVVRQVSPEEHSRSEASHGAESGIGSGNRVPRRRVCGDVFFYGCSARHKRCAAKSQWDRPLPLRLGHVERS